MGQPGLGRPADRSPRRAANRKKLGYDADSPGISADGRTLIFASEDPALSDEDVNFARGPLGEPTINPVRDIFAYDRITKAITLVSRRSGANGQAANDDSNLPAISPDGRYVAFGTESSNLTAGKHIDGGTYVRDLKANDDHPRLARRRRTGETARRLRTDALHGGARWSPSSGPSGTGSAAATATT